MKTVITHKFCRRPEGLFRLRWIGDATDIFDVLEPRVKSGHLEKSNVDSITEMVALMTAFREFESVAQTLRTITSDMDNLRTITSDMDKQMLAELADLS